MSECDDGKHYGGGFAPAAGDHQLSGGRGKGPQVLEGREGVRGVPEAVQGEAKVSSGLLEGQHFGANEFRVFSSGFRMATSFRIDSFVKS